MSASAVSVESQRSRNFRIAPTVPVAIAVFVAYVVAFIGLSATSGVAYDQWFASGENAFRSAVVPLVGGSAVLIVFILWARWDWVFADPVRLPMYRSMWVAIAIFVAGIAVHLVAVDWGRVSAGLLTAILAAGVLVGFAEETLFRGVILRTLRSNLRPEAWVILVSSVWFGFFHFTNVANGVEVGKAIIQCLVASCAGLVLYLFRRSRGMLLLGMVAHGIWDMSVFLPVKSGSGELMDLAVQVVLVVAALVAAIVIMRKDRSIALSGNTLVAV